MKTSTFLSVLLPGLLLLSACSESGPKAAKKPAAPPEPVTGRVAFQRMYVSARGWAIDAEPLQLQSYLNTEVKSEGGKSPVWQATFVSATLQKTRVYTWAALDQGESLHKGVFAGPEGSWSGPTGQEQPYDMVAVRVDSDAALETALKQKDSVDYEKKNPGKPVTFILEKTRRAPDVSWRVLWGETVGTSEYSVLVDATTGKYLEKIR